MNLCIKNPETVAETFSSSLKRSWDRKGRHEMERDEGHEIGCEGTGDNRIGRDGRWRG